MIQYVLNHPWLLTLLGIPTLLASVPILIRKLEVIALKRLVQNGDATDQKALRSTVAVWVTWAEEKYGASQGAAKFAAVDAVLAKALPFLSSDDRKKFIEAVLAQLDAGAHEVSDSPAINAVAPVPPKP